MKQDCGNRDICGGTQMTKNRKNTVIITLIMCVLTACGTKQGADGEKETDPGTDAVLAAEATAGILNGSDGGGYISDDMSISSEDNIEFTVIRIKDEYFDIRRRGEWLELHNVYTHYI